MGGQHDQAQGIISSEICGLIPCQWGLWTLELGDIIGIADRGLFLLYDLRREEQVDPSFGLHQFWVIISRSYCSDVEGRGWASLFTHHGECCQFAASCAWVPVPCLAHDSTWSLWYKSPCFNSKRKLSDDEINNILPYLLRKFRQPFAEMLSKFQAIIKQLLSKIYTSFCGSCKHRGNFVIFRISCKVKLVFIQR